jgi:hypothetical protein
VPHKPLGRDPGHCIVRVVNALPAVVAEREDKVSAISSGVAARRSRRFSPSTAQVAIRSHGAQSAGSTLRRGESAMPLSLFEPAYICVRTAIGEDDWSYLTALQPVVGAELLCTLH